MPGIDDVQALIDDYRQKKEISVGGGSILDNRQKKDSKIRLARALKKWAIYVNDIANGDLTTLVSSGMILAKQPEDSDVPAIIGWIKLKDGPTTGQIAATFEAQKNVKAYEVQVGVISEGQSTIQWRESLQCNSSRNFLITDLEPGVRYFVRVRARSLAGFGNWSEPVSLIAR